ncbi:hypothetical protein H6768_06200 [Candidatus Peribacteria bacterium]|nr:hypothetical protein [Candidatus Peribacteria bacterium]
MIIQKSSPETEKKDIQPIKKTEPDEKTDEIAKELDSIIDDLISGK